MENNLDLEQFNPTRAELQDLAEKYSKIEIKGVEDKIGYQLADEARKNLKRKRVEIEKKGKEMRDEAIKFQKAVISKEKEFVAIIEPIEIALQEKQNAIDWEIEKRKRLEFLPAKIERLAKINVLADEEEILKMDDQKFEVYFNEKHAEYLAEVERKQKEQQDKIDAENKRIEEEKRLAEIKEQARIEAEKKAKQEIENVKLKAEKEKQALIDKQKREEEQKKKDEEEKARQEKEEQEALEKKKKYQKFLTDNNYNADTDKLFNTDDGVVLYRKMAEFKK